MNTSDTNTTATDAVSLAKLRAVVSLQAEGLSKWQQHMLAGMLKCQFDYLPYSIGKADKKELDSLLVACVEIKRAASIDAKGAEALAKISAAIPGTEKVAASPDVMVGPGSCACTNPQHNCHGLGIGQGRVVCFRSHCGCEFPHVVKK